MISRRCLFSQASTRRLSTIPDACTQRALAKGVASTLHIGPRMQHDWPLTLPWLAESRDAWAAIAAFAEKTVTEAEKRRAD